MSLVLGAASAEAATPAETMISDNIRTGLQILGDRQASAADRAARFNTFLLGVTDLKRVSKFVLGRYDAQATPAERDAFAAAFQRYAVSVYQSYLGKYSGQTLTVTGSQHVAAGDDVVNANLIDPASNSRPLELSFRVNSSGAAPVIVDFSVGGIWLALEERDQFTAFLGQNGGSIPALIDHLDAIRAKLSTAG
ncbi:MAG: ABC transporter substrate-binding protein [Rhizomicrobium sp.]